MTDYQKYLKESNLNDPEKIRDLGRENVFSIECPHGHHISFGSLNEKFLFSSCEKCKALFNIPIVESCVVCNQGEIMPLMQHYVDTAGKSVREASRLVEAYFFDRYGKESPVTADRAFKVYQNRKGKIESDDSDKSLNHAGLEQKKTAEEPVTVDKSTQSQPPQMSFDHALKVLCLDKDLGWDLFTLVMKNHYKINEMIGMAKKVPEAIKVIRIYVGRD